jgi:hypothetical protein
MIVLDTHIWVWWVDESPQLSERHAQLIQASESMFEDILGPEDKIFLYSSWHSDSIHATVSTGHPIQSFPGIENASRAVRHLAETP